MPYTLIKGEFHIFYPDLPRSGPQPDGDTLRFKPDNPVLAENLSGRSPNFNGRGTVAVRFEGIDTLETHFEQMHQNLELANAARNRLLAEMGFGAVTYWPDLPNNVRTVEHNPVRGTILARSVESHGRIVAFVYSVNIPGKNDGDNVFVDEALLDQSMNAKLMAAGLAYPEYYTSLPQTLQLRLTELATDAWEGDKGVWPVDTANVEQFANIPDLGALQPLVIWPKLFRRLASYFASGHAGLAGFDAWLRDDTVDRDDRLITPDDPDANMHDVFEIHGNQIKMKYWPEEIIIRPDP